MAKKLTIEEVAEQEGFNTANDILLYYGFSSVVPACCDEGCTVEPDGHCQHGHPSILLEYGII